jgi:hypothetical protein
MRQRIVGWWSRASFARWLGCGLVCDSVLSAVSPPLDTRVCVVESETRPAAVFVLLQSCLLLKCEHFSNAIEHAVQRGEPLDGLRSRKTDYLPSGRLNANRNPSSDSSSSTVCNS